MENKMEMLDKVVKTTRNFTKVHGLIQCNRGSQEDEVRYLLSSHGYVVEDVNNKKSRANLSYLKKEVLNNGN